MLSRALVAAGLGLPAEYFNPRVSGPSAERWRCPHPSGTAGATARYLDELLAHRSVDGIFASKLQFWQFRRYLCNPVGAGLFKDATVVFLLREDLLGQVASFAVALETDSWGDGDDGTAAEPSAPLDEDLLHRSFDGMLAEEHNWRRFFLLAGLKPLILVDRVVNEDTERAVRDIARRMAVEIDEEGLTAFSRGAARYTSSIGRKEAYRTLAGSLFAGRAFAYDEYSTKAFLGRMIRRKVARMRARIG